MRSTGLTMYDAGPHSRQNDNAAAHFEKMHALFPVVLHYKMKWDECADVRSPGLTMYDAGPHSRRDDNGAARGDHEWPVLGVASPANLSRDP